MYWTYLYLILDVFAISLPLASSFRADANFSKTYKRLIPAITLPAAVFIIWDVYFTEWGVWGFNSAYLTGIIIINLPLEEWLFFICIPYACVFTYFSFGFLIEKDHFKPYARSISWALITGLTIIGLMNLERWYTSTTFLSLSLFLLYHVLVLKSNYLSRFYFAYLFILIPFFLINGILTGSGIEDQVVWYDNTKNLGIRLGTIPVEDAFYGMLLILMNITIFEGLRRK
ncbi:MAG: lycopene cyclase domain-containing protein [Bacteroidota bacterium]